MLKSLGVDSTGIAQQVADLVTFMQATADNTAAIGARLAAIDEGVRHLGLLYADLDRRIAGLEASAAPADGPPMRPGAVLALVQNHAAVGNTDDVAKG